MLQIASAFAAAFVAGNFSKYVGFKQGWGSVIGFLTVIFAGQILLIRREMSRKGSRFLLRWIVYMISVLFIMSILYSALNVKYDNFFIINVLVHTTAILTIIIICSIIKKFIDEHLKTSKKSFYDLSKGVDDRWLD